MNFTTPGLLLLGLGLMTPVSPVAKIKIDNVPAEYMPTAGAQLPEPVSVESYRFELNREMTWARVVVEYTYPNQAVFGLDGGSGPPPTSAQLPGLTYDSLAHAVVYNDAGKRTVCAIVKERKGRFGRRFDIKNTGSCVVTATVADQVGDFGKSTQRFRAIDIYFEVH